MTDNATSPILGDEVTGVAGEGDILDLPLGSLPEVDHFRDIKKMIPDVIPGGAASGLGLLDDLGEVLPPGVSKEHLEIPSTPELDPRFGMLSHHLLEAGVEPNHHLLIHEASSHRA